MLVTLGGTQKTDDVGYYLETFFILESNKISILQVVFQRLRGFIMLKANLQEFNFVLLIFNLLL
jgi:hypothetical protein